MNASTTAKTLFEDWQHRRQYFESRGGTNPRKAVHIKVLDYLILRYRNSAKAHLPARFALRPELHWNDRRITVHHHLGRGQVGGVESRDQAEQRIAGLVQRMLSDERSEDDDFTPTDLADIPRIRSWRNIPIWRIKLGWNADSQIRNALASWPLLPKACVDHLVSRLIDVTQEDMNALDLFLQCKNSGILYHTVRAWRDRVVQGKSTGSIIQALEARIRSPGNRPLAAELIRERLADDEAPVRIAASHLIAKIGDLDDIGLLSDLLALPESSDEDPNERDAIIGAMSTIAERDSNS
jgi:hypothetical protein